VPLTESQAFHAWAARQPSTRERLRAFWSHWFRKENPHMSDKHDHVEMLGDLPDTAPENPRNTPPPRTAWSQDPWPGVDS